jgi:hypothetical protein
VAAAVSSAPVRAADLQPETIAAYERYVQLTDERLQSELTDPQRFVWFDFPRTSDGRRREVARALERGEVVLERLETRDGNAEIRIPHGLVHHWVGVVFVPGATAQQAVAVMQDYDRHDEIFAPRISQSRVLSRSGDTFRFTMRFVITGVLSAVLQTDQEARFFFPGPARAHSRIAGTRIVEIANAGTPAEAEKPEGRDRGYLWRQTSYWRFLERDGGTYVQCEVISLSRGLPAGLGWLFGRAATGVPKDTLSFTLQRVRETLVRPRVIGS